MKVKLEDQIREINKIPSVTAIKIGPHRIRLVFSRFPVGLETAYGYGLNVRYKRQRAKFKGSIAVDLCGGEQHKILDNEDIDTIPRAVIRDIPYNFECSGIHSSLNSRITTRKYGRIADSRYEDYSVTFCLREYKISLWIRDLLINENYIEAALMLKTFMTGLQGLQPKYCEDIVDVW